MAPSAATNRDATTQAYAILAPPRRPGHPWTWIIPTCPYCGSRHTHGAGHDGNRAGTRIAHCHTSTPRPTYRLTPMTAETNAA